VTDARGIEVSLSAELIEHLGPLAVMASVRDDDGQIVDFRYELVNTAFSKAVQEPADVLLGSCLLELYPSHVELGLFDEYCRVVDTGRWFVGELPWFDERNVRGCLEIRATKFRDGYLVQGWDITEAKLAAQFEDLQSALDAMPEAVGIYTPIRDDEGVVTDFVRSYVNSTGAGNLAVDRADLLGSGLKEWLPESTADGARRELSQVLETGSDATFVIALDDGTDRAFRVTAAPAGDAVVASATELATTHHDHPAQRIEPQRPDGHDAMHTTLPVDVWCRSTSRWVPGFRVHRVEPDGTVRVRRESDGMVLPEPFPRDALRLPATLLDSTHLLPRPDDH